MWDLSLSESTHAGRVYKKAPETTGGDEKREGKEVKAVMEAG